MLAQTCAAIGAATVGSAHASEATTSKNWGSAPGFKFSLNMATIRGQKLSLPEQVDVAAKAGYHAIEPWVEELHRYTTSGGSAADLKKRIGDLGLVVPSAIGFADFAKVWQERVTPTLSPRTAERWSGFVEMHLKPAFSGALRAITRATIENYMIRRLEAGATPATVNNEFTLIRHMLKRAVAWEYLSANPASGIKALKEPAGAVRKKDTRRRYLIIGTTWSMEETTWDRKPSRGYRLTVFASREPVKNIQYTTLSTRTNSSCS